LVDYSADSTADYWVCEKVEKKAALKAVCSADYWAVSKAVLSAD
jgi:hypothetical protein